MYASSKTKQHCPMSDIIFLELAFVSMRTSNGLTKVGLKLPTQNIVCGMEANQVAICHHIDDHHHDMDSCGLHDSFIILLLLLILSFSNRQFLSSFSTQRLLNFLLYNFSYTCDQLISNQTFSEFNSCNIFFLFFFLYIYIYSFMCNVERHI